MEAIEQQTTSWQDGLNVGPINYVWERMGVCLTKRKWSNTENMYLLFDAFINHMDGCRWMMIKSMREGKNTKSILILTSLRGNRQWLFCWGPHPCKGTEQCRRWYSSASHSQSETGSPVKEMWPQVKSCLWEHMGQIMSSQSQVTSTYLFGVHVEFLTAHGHLFIPLHIFPETPELDVSHVNTILLMNKFWYKKFRATTNSFFDYWLFLLLLLLLLLSKNGGKKSLKASQNPCLCL